MILEATENVSDEAQQCEHCNVHIVSLAGEEVASLRAPAASTILQVKRRIQDRVSSPPFCQQLLLGDRILENVDVLFGIPQSIGMIELTFIALQRHEHEPELNDRLNEAATWGVVETAHDVLKLRADPDHVNEHGQCPLLIAARSGHLDVVVLLQRAGADMHKHSHDGITALHYAAHEGHEDVVRHLCESQAALDQQKHGGATPLSWSAQAGRLKTTRCLLAFNACLEKPREDGGTPLCVASHGGHCQVVELLCEARANVNVVVDNGVTPLLLAARAGSIATVQHLCDKGADKDAATSTGATPLLIASRLGHLRIVEYLCFAKADIDKAGQGQTPLSASCNGGHVDITNFLIGFGQAAADH